ncbi:MAG: hypothetical protein V3T05_13515 [Myxococcota bacterium]
MFDRVAYDRGVHLRGTSLWFDAERKRELCVLTCLTARLPPLHKRAVASPDMVAALERSGFRGAVLPAPWDRWIGLGGQQVRLLPAGAEPGAAIVMVSSGREIVLLAGLLRRHMVKWPRAEHLVAVTPALGHRGAGRDQVLRGLEMFIDQAEADGVRAAVAVDSLEVGIELHNALLHRGRQLRPMGLLAKLIGDGGASMHSTLALAGGRVAASARVAWVDTGVAAWTGRRVPATPAATFRFRWYADWSTLRHAVSMTGASRVALVVPPTVTPALVRRNLGSAVEVRLLGTSRQLALAGT